MMSRRAAPCLLLLACQTQDAPLRPGLVVEPAAPTTLDEVVATPADPQAEVRWEGPHRAQVAGRRLAPELTRRGQTWRAVRLDGKGQAEVSIANSPPQVSVALPAPPDGQPLVALATAVDPDQDPLALSWRWQVDGAPTAFDGPEVPVEALLQGARWQVEVSADDGAGGLTSATAELTLGDLPPQVTELRVEPDPPTRAAGARALAQGVDREGEPVSFTYRWSISGGPFQEGEFLPPGSFQRGQLLTLEATPTAGGQAGATARLEVIAGNSPPSTEPPSYLPFPPTVDWIVCQPGASTDVDGDLVRVDLSWEIDGIFAGVGPEFDGSLLRTGRELVCVATPHDGYLAGTPARSPAGVRVNNLPTLVEARFDPPIPHARQDLTAVSTWADVDLQAVSVEVTWTVNGAPAGAGPTLSEAAFQEGDLVQATLVASDGEGSAAPVVLEVVPTNAPPTVRITLSPDPAYADSLITATVDADDEEGDAFTLLPTGWLLNDALIPGAVGDTFDAALSGATARDRVVAEVTADADGALSTTQSAALVLSNTLPSFSVVVVQPTPLVRHHVVGCDSPDLYHPDRELLRWVTRWWVDGVEVSGEPTLDLASYEVGQQISCAREAFDAEGSSGEVRSIDYAIQNAPPRALPRLVPDRPSPGEAIQCRVYAEDPDGDPLSVEVTWWRDGERYLGPTTSVEWPGDQLPAGVSAEGEAWRCAAAASDGVQTGPWSDVEWTLAPPLGGNVLIVVLDDIGVDKVGAYGLHPDPPPTPTMDGLAADGVLFRNFYAYPSCSPTRAAALTGRFGRRTGMGNIVTVNRDLFELPLDEVLLPEALVGTDYQSAAVGKWHLSGFSTPSFYEHPVLQGFGSWSGTAGNLNFTQFPDAGLTSYFYWEKAINGGEEVLLTDVYATIDTTDDALTQAALLPEPWVLWVAYHAPHDPFHVPPAELTSLEVSLESDVYTQHAAMVESVDRELGRLLDGLGAQRERTTVLVLGDNGTHKDATSAPFDPARAKPSLYEGGTHVPLIVQGPWVQAPGREVDALTHAVDVFPTVVEAAGVSPWEATERWVDGQSLLPYLQDPDWPGRRRALYTERFVPNGAPPYPTLDQRAMRDDAYKLLQLPGLDLFFRLSDPATEGEDLLAAGPLDPATDARYRELKRELEAFWTTLDYAHD